MLESIFLSTATSEAVITFTGLVAALSTSLVLGLVISLVYMRPQKSKALSQSFSLTLVMLRIALSIRFSSYSPWYAHSAD